MNSNSLISENVVAIPAQSLVQFAYVEDSSEYKFAADNSIPDMKLEGFPVDSDYSRYAMLHDGEAYRVYLFRQNSNDTLYQGAFNPDTETYQFGYNSIPEVKLANAPEGADFSSFAMLFDGENYRLYLRPLGAPVNVIQFVFNDESEAYEYNPAVNPDWPITGTPVDADWNGWGMLHDGEFYRMYTWKGGTNHTQIYQAAFDEDEGAYVFGFASIPVLNIVGTPSASYRSGFAMLYDGENYRFYLQTV